MYIFNWPVVAEGGDKGQVKVFALLAQRPDVQDAAGLDGADFGAEGGTGGGGSQEGGRRIWGVRWHRRWRRRLHWAARQGLLVAGGQWRGSGLQKSQKKLHKK